MAADLKYVINCAKDIAKYSKTDKIVVEKSTLPVRTAEKIKQILREENKDVNFEILSNPEFLAEGTAINDLFKSDRVLIGGENTDTGTNAINQLVKIYSRWIPREKILTTNVWTSELAKLASNAMLAQRISSINSFSALCEKSGANVFELSKAIGMDKRIGPHFLNASVGFGGSCFKKDILNLVYLSKHYGLTEVAEFWLQVIKINDYQKNRFANKIIEALNDKNDKLVGMLGWSFKENTNDSRESASIYVAKILLENNINLKIYDPLVEKSSIISDLKNKNTSNISNLYISSSVTEAIESADLVAIMINSDEFKNINSDALIFDGRGANQYSTYTIGKLNFMDIIKMVDLKNQYLNIKEDIDNAIKSTVNSTEFIGGENIEKFKLLLKEYLDVKYVIPCANGTDALQISLMALNLNQGDEIIVPAFTYVSTAEVISLLGLKPIIIDVEYNNFNISINNIEELITDRTKAIIPVHLFGQSSPMEEILNFASKYNLFVIEDNAQALGAEYIFNDGKRQKLGTIGDIGCTSFFPSKNLGCFGDGGAIFTNNKVLGEKLMMICNHGQSKKYYHDIIGCNSRLDSIQAAILNVKLKYLDIYNEKRRRLHQNIILI